MKDEDGRITTYAYDGSNWLTRVDYPNGQIIKYTYNGAGDRVSEQIGNDVVLTSSYDAAGRLLSRGNDTFGYDADGNLINALEGEVPASYTWNSDNRLTMVSRVHNGCKHDKERNGYGYGHLKHGSSFVEYEKYYYLPEDWRRITRTVGVQKTAKNKNTAVEEEVFVSVYDGSDESHEYRLLTGKAASLQLEQSYFSDPGTDDLNFTLSAGKTLTMLKDGLGSTVALTGNDGKVLAKIGYDAWGRFMWPTEAEDGSFDRSKDDWSDYLNRLDKTRSFGKHNAWAFGKQFADQLTPYLYTGRRFSAMTGEYWNRHRYYSPALGRFTTKDPISFRGGHNLYRYADNNPMRFVDPMGLSSDECSLYKDLHITLLNVPSKDSTTSFFIDEGLIRSSFQFLNSLPSSLTISHQTTSTPIQKLNSFRFSLLTRPFLDDYTVSFMGPYLRGDNETTRFYSVFLADTGFPDGNLGLTDPIPGKRILVDVPNHPNLFQTSRTICHELGHAIGGLAEGDYSNTVMQQGFNSFTNFDRSQEAEIENALKK